VIHSVSMDDNLPVDTEELKKEVRRLRKQVLKLSRMLMERDDAYSEVVYVGEEFEDGIESMKKRRKRV